MRCHAYLAVFCFMAAWWVCWWISGVLHCHRENRKMLERYRKERGME